MAGRARQRPATCVRESFCDRPGSASNSPMITITGLPLPKDAVNAVGMPATPLFTSKPLARSSCCSSARALGFVKAQFGRFPDLPRNGAEAVGVSGDAGQNIVGGQSGAGGEEQCQNFTHG